MEPNLGAFPGALTQRCSTRYSKVTGLSSPSWLPIHALRVHERQPREHFKGRESPKTLQGTKVMINHGFKRVFSFLLLPQR